MAKVLLLTPPNIISTVLNRRVKVPSLGILYIATSLEQRGIEVRVFDANFEDFTFSQLENVVKDYVPDIVGISFSTENRADGFRAARLVKRINPAITIIGGGTHCTLAADDTLKHIPEIDLIVREEGEITAYEVIKTIENQQGLESIDGISFRKDGEIIHNPNRSFIKDINSIPFPAYHLVNMSHTLYENVTLGFRSTRVAPLITSRGCPFRCNFCAASSMWEGSTRLRSTENVLSEITILVDRYGIDTLWILDDAFTMSKKRCIQICDQLIQNNLNLTLVIQGARIDQVNEELFDKLKKVGCIFINFGVESGSQRIINEFIGKRIKIEKVIEVSKLCSKFNILGSFDFIVSHPTETVAEARETLDLCHKIKEDGNMLNFNVMRIYPGTRLEQYAREKNIFTKDFSWAQEDRMKGTLLARTLKGGNVPFFREKMSWEQIFEVVIEWVDTEKYDASKHYIDILKNVRSFDDVKTLLMLAKVKCKRMFSL